MARLSRHRGIAHARPPWQDPVCVALLTLAASPTQANGGLTAGYFLRRTWKGRVAAEHHVMEVFLPCSSARKAEIADTGESRERSASLDGRLPHLSLTAEM